MEEEVSGWDDIQTFFTSTLQSSQHTFVDDNIDDISKVLAVENVKLKLTKILSKSVKCPLCDYEFGVRKSKGVSVKTILDGMKKHLLEHERNIEIRKGLTCPICEVSYSEAYMKKHFRVEHPDEDFPEFPDTSEESGVLASLLKKIDERAKFAHQLKIPVENEFILKKSKFKGFKMLVSLKKFQSTIAEQFEQSSKYSVFFHYKSYKRKDLLMKWVCALCEPDTVGYLPHKFRNDISLRLFVLRHFTHYHPHDERLMQLCEKEWDYLRKDTGKELQEYNKYSSRFETKNRSIWFHMEAYCDKNKDLITEMISRGHCQDNIPSETAICLICMNPVSERRLVSHFSSDECHKQLQVHPERTEFQLINEIAEFNQLDEDLYPFGILRYSKMFCLTENDITSSVAVYKWRCPLPCETNGHISDVLHFPSENLLQLYVLKHFLDFHEGFFSDSFLQYEWKCLSNQFRLPRSLLHSDPVKEATHFEIDDPNDYQCPWAARILPKGTKEFKICYFCFWCGLSDSFLDHISIHGFIQTDKRIVSNDDVYSHLSDKITKKNYIPLELGKVPKKVLGPIGKTFLEDLRKQNELIEMSEAAASLSESEDTEMDVVDEPRQSKMEEPDDVDVNNASFSSSRRGSLRESARNASLKITQSLGDDTWKQSMIDPPSSSSSSCESSSDSMVYLPTNDARTDTADSSKEDNEDQESVKSATPRFLPFSSTLTENMSNTSTTCSESFPVVISEKIPGEKLQMIKKRFEESSTEILSEPTYYELKALELMKKRRCFLCVGCPLIKVSARSANSNGMTENYVLSHFILNHHENETVQLLLERKRRILLTKEPFFPTPFLLEAKGYLKCSVCADRTCDRFSVLLTHFLTCVNKPDKKTGPVVEDSTKSVACPLPNCGLRLRGSAIYDLRYTQLIHLLVNHTDEKEAYTKAMEMKEEFDFGENIPYTDVSKSFTNTMEYCMLMLACSMCDKVFHKPQELVAHSTRYHTDGIKCPYKCSNSCVISRKHISKYLSLALHIISWHYKREDVLSHVTEKACKLAMDEKVYRVDLKKSVEESLKLGKSVFVCLDCGDMVCCTKFSTHVQRCSDISENELRLLRGTPKKVNTGVVSDTSGSGRKTTLPRVLCRFCRRSFLGCLTEEATLLSHCWKNHKGNANVEKWLKTIDVDEWQKKLPQLDVKKGMEAFFSAEPTNKLNFLFCSKCSKGFSTLSHLISHNVLHQLNNVVEEDPSTDFRFCQFCNKTLKKALNYNGLVGLAAHFIEVHSDMDLISALNEKQKNIVRTTVPFINFEKSVTAKKLICSLCDLSFGLLRNMITHSFVIHSHECQSEDVKPNIKTLTLTSTRTPPKPNVITQSTPKKRSGRNLQLENDFGATESPIVSFNSDKDKWKDAFNRYGKVQEDLREKSRTSVGNNNNLKTQTKVSSFFRQTASQPKIEESKETTPPTEDSADIPSSKCSQSSGWLNMENAQSVVTPKRPALRLRAALQSTSGTQNSETLADALSTVLDSSKTANSSFRDDSLLSLLPSTVVNKVTNSELPPNDLSHIPGVNGFKCKRCNFVALKVQDVSKHMQFEHADGTKDLKVVRRDVLASCIICKKCFPNRQKLFVHIKDAHADEPKPYPCSFCSKGYPTYRRVREHERRMHEDSLNLDSSSLQCSHCNLVFLNIRNKKLHEKRHEMSSK